MENFWLLVIRLMTILRLSKTKICGQISHEKELIGNQKKQREYS